MALWSLWSLLLCVGVTWDWELLLCGRRIWRKHSNSHEKSGLSPFIPSTLIEPVDRIGDPLWIDRATRAPQRFDAKGSLL